MVWFDSSVNLVRVGASPLEGLGSITRIVAVPPQNIPIESFSYNDIDINQVCSLYYSIFALVSCGSSQSIYPCKIKVALLLSYNPVSMFWLLCAYCFV